MIEQEQNIRALIALAEKAIADESAGTDVFLESVAHYILALEDWRANVAPEGEATRVDEPSRLALGELNEIHHRLLARANELKQSLVSEMGEAKKKAGALRAYVDRFPQRITITGKREG